MCLFSKLKVSFLAYFPLKTSYRLAYVVVKVILPIINLYLLYHLILTLLKQNIPTACYDWPCKNDGNCGVQSTKCHCSDPHENGTQQNKQCNKGNEFRNFITLSQVICNKQKII